MKMKIAIVAFWVVSACDFVDFGIWVVVGIVVWDFLAAVVAWGSVGRALALDSSFLLSVSRTVVDHCKFK